MHQTIVRIGAFELRAYGLALAISFLVGILLAIKRGKKRGVDAYIIMDLAVLIVIGAIVGSRFLYVIAHLDEFRGRWLDTVNPFQSTGQIGIAGLTMLGGVILALLLSIIYLRAKKLPVLKIADVLIPSVALGIFITRIGCYFNGCCFGLPCTGSLGVVFPPDSVAGDVFPNTAIHPTQLYSSFYGLVILALLLLVEKNKRFDGFLLYAFLAFYGIARFIVDFFRYYESSMVLTTIGNHPISVNQGISFVFVVVGLLLIGNGLRRQYQMTDPESSNVT